MAYRLILVDVNTLESARVEVSRADAQYLMIVKAHRVIVEIDGKRAREYKSMWAAARFVDRCDAARTEFILINERE